MQRKKCRAGHAHLSCIYIAVIGGLPCYYSQCHTVDLQCPLTKWQKKYIFLSCFQGCSPCWVMKLPGFIKNIKIQPLSKFCPKGACPSLLMMRNVRVRILSNRWHPSIKQRILSLKFDARHHGPPRDWPPLPRDQLLPTESTNLPSPPTQWGPS